MLCVVWREVKTSVALETSLRDSEIAETHDLTREMRLSRFSTKGIGEHNGGSATTGRTNRRLVAAGCGSPGEEARRASRRFGSGGGPGDGGGCGCRRGR